MKKSSYIGITILAIIIAFCGYAAYSFHHISEVVQPMTWNSRWAGEQMARFVAKNKRWPTGWDDFERNVPYDDRNDWQFERIRETIKVDWGFNINRPDAIHKRYPISGLNSELYWVSNTNPNDLVKEAIIRLKNAPNKLIQEADPISGDLGSGGRL